MTDTLLNCGANGWLMIADGLLTYGVLALAGTALVKYVFFSTHGSAARITPSTFQSPCARATRAFKGVAEMEVTRHEVLPRPSRSLYSRLISENSGIWLVGWRSFAICAVVIAACTVPIVWVAVTDPAQLLLLLPCAVMMFVCMKGIGHEPQMEATQSSAPRDARAGTTSEE